MEDLSRLRRRRAANSTDIKRVRMGYDQIEINIRSLPACVAGGISRASAFVLVVKP